MKTLLNLVTAIFLILPVASFAQWSSDPLLNTPIDISSAEQTLPKIATDQESGNVFIAYFSFASGNYDLMLQYLNHQGYPIWQEPLVVSNNLQDYMLTDYGAMIDYDGNCVIAFSDIRSSSFDVYVYKVSPGGQQLWGEQGIRLSDHPAAEYSPVLCITQDNNAIVSWIEEDAETGNQLIMAAIDPDGNLIFNDDKIIWVPDGDYSYASPYLIPTIDGDFIAIFRRSSGPPWSHDKFIYAQRLDVSGNPVWLAETHINDAGGLTIWDVLSIKGDDEGGFYIAWDDDRDLDAVRESFIQHVDASGDLLFTANGLLVSTQFSQRFYPEVAGWNDDNDVFVYWKQAHIEREDEDALYGQRISKEGSRMWTDNGKEIIPYDKGLNVISGCDVRNNLSYLFYIINGIDVTDQRIRAKCLDSFGNSVWGIDDLSVSEVQKEAHHTFLSDYFEGQWIMAWSDTRVPERDLYAQNINEGGSIGNLTGIAEQDQQEVDIYPNPCNKTLNISQKGYQQLYLLDLAGQVVLEQKIKQGNNFINVGDFNPGIYILKLTGLKETMSAKVGVVGY